MGMLTLACTLFMGVKATQANPDDIYWNLHDLNIGIQGSVNTMVLRDGFVFAAGSFSKAGELSDVNNIVRFDIENRTWHRLAPGPNNSIRKIISHGDYLYVGGHFTEVGGEPMNNIARYNVLTDTWESMNSPFSGQFHQINAMTVADDMLYMTGNFFTAYGNFMTSYNTVTGTWHALPSLPNGPVADILAHGEYLYAAGGFNGAGGIDLLNISLARYHIANGTWHPMPTQVLGNPHKLMVHDGYLYAGGVYSELYGSLGNGVLRFNLTTDTWEKLGDGVKIAGILVVFQEVNGMVPIGDNLYVGGNFDRAGGQSVSNIARYNFTTGTWHTMGAGIGGNVRSMLSVDDILVIGGSYSRMDTQFSGSIGLYNTTSQTWTPSSDNRALTGSVNHMVLTGNTIYAGGSFTAAGDLPLNRIARYDVLSEQWHPLTGGLNGAVRRISLRDEHLIVTGGFSQAGGVAASQVARYNLNTGVWNGYSATFAGDVFTATTYNGYVYMGGNFWAISPIPVTGPAMGIANLVRHDPETNGWTNSGISANGTVRKLEVIGDYMYVAGDFTTIGGISSHGIARLHLPTHTWEGFGSDVGNIRDFHFVNSDLYVVGDFVVSNGKAGNRVARYNFADQTWYPLGTGIPVVANTILAFGEVVYVAGPTNNTGTSRGILRFDADTETWFHLGSGIGFSNSAAVNTMVFTGEAIYIGGGFSTAGNQTAVNFSRWQGPDIDELIPVYHAEFEGPSPGWRLVGSPIPFQSYYHALKDIWTQGYPGAKTTAGAPNVYWYDESSRSFQPPSSASNITGSNVNVGFNNAGRGFIVYMFDEDEYGSSVTVWPKTLSIRGVPFLEDQLIEYPQTLLEDDTMQGWHLATNPFSVPVSWMDLVADGGLQDMLTVIFVYDPNNFDGQGGYRVNYGFPIPNLPNNVAYDGILEPFQGFWVRTTGLQPSGSIAFRTRYAATGGTVYKNQPNSDKIPSFLSFAVSGQNLSAATVLTLNQGDEHLTTAPLPLAAQYIRFGFTEVGESQPVLLRNTEFSSGDRLILPLEFEATESGTYTIDLSANTEYPDLNVTITDRLTGKEHVFVNDSPFVFSYTADPINKARLKRSAEHTIPLALEMLTLATSGPRFELSISRASTTGTEMGRDLPNEFTLSQNYPNPFNPSTVIRYGLPVHADVRLEVFNALGQRVAVLVNGSRNAGWHEVNLDASRLASGMYIYRLTAGGTSHTRQMMLIK